MYSQESYRRVQVHMLGYLPITFSTAINTKVTAFRDIITGDETWLYYYDPENKCHSMEWKHPQLPVKRKLRMQPLVRKVMLAVFWGSCEKRLEHHQDGGMLPNSASFVRCVMN